MEYKWRIFEVVNSPIDIIMRTIIALLLVVVAVTLAQRKLSFEITSVLNFASTIVFPGGFNGNFNGGGMNTGGSMTPQGEIASWCNLPNVEL